MVIGFASPASSSPCFTELSISKSISCISSNKLICSFNSGLNFRVLSRGSCLTAISTKKHGQISQTFELEPASSEDDFPHKPLGFGVGKTYDTSLEEKLLEEIERDKAGQAAAALKREHKGKTQVETIGSDKRTTKNVDTSLDVGIKVSVRDLPKKKNIKRDLQSAFRYVPGLLEISPSVIGNEKTRDPICKGFGFLIFDTVENAKRFISSFEDEPIQFGKVQKQLSYKLLTKNTAEEVIPSTEEQNEVPMLKVREKADMLSVPTSVSSVDRKGEFNTVSEGDDDVIWNSEEEDSTEGFTDSYEEEETDDSDDEIEVEMSCVVEDMRLSDILNADHQDDQNTIEAERRIEELENRLRKKLEAEGFGDTNAKAELTRKPGGFNKKKDKASKRSLASKNNTASLIGGLRKKEREVMLGVLEKYGKKC